MNIASLSFAATVGLVVASIQWVATQGPDAPPRGSQLAPPAFHHVHHNSADPAAAIAAYEKLFPGAVVRTTLAGIDGIRNGDVSLLFSKVATPPPTQPQSAFLRHVWAVADIRAFVKQVRAAGMDVLPLHTLEGTTVDVSADTYQNGLTRAAYDESRAKGTLPPPTHTGGYIYMRGPENVLTEVVERANTTAPRYILVDMWQDDSLCAELWYRRHLNLPQRAGRGGAPAPEYTDANCRVPKSDPSFPSIQKEGTRRLPGGGATFGDVNLNWFVSQGDVPLAPTRGQYVDHLAVSVPSLDPWIAKLKAEHVTLLQQAYTIGGMRAVMIEGPSHEAIEILEKK